MVAASTPRAELSLLVQINRKNMATFGITARLNTRVKSSETAINSDIVINPTLGNPRR